MSDYISGLHKFIRFLKSVLLSDITYQQNRCPTPQSTACDVSDIWLASAVFLNDGDRGFSKSGSLTARPQPGYGHHLMLGLLSTKAYKTNASFELVLTNKIIPTKMIDTGVSGWVTYLPNHGIRTYSWGVTASTRKISPKHWQHQYNMRKTLGFKLGP